MNVFAYGAVTRCGPTFQSVRLTFTSAWRRSYNPASRFATPAVWALPRSLATTCGIIFIFSSYGYLDVSVPHVRPRLSRVSRSSLDGLPHSDISGSRCICHSPELFAAYHVLRRLREPRHPPYALLCFLLSFRSSSFHSSELFARSVSFASNTSMIFCFVVPGRFELPTSTLSV